MKIVASTTAFLLLVAAPSLSFAEEYLNGIQWDEPRVVDPGESDDAPPSDAIVLFDGSDLSEWENAETWKIEDGAMVVGSKAIVSKQSFGDIQLHAEWSAPTPAKGEGQGRGNSGIFLMNRYEIQVLDSFENPTYFDGQAGGIYKQTPPAVNATRPPGQWNTYDIFWTAPRFNEDGSLKSPAYITAVHNGVLIQNHFELKGDTPYNRPPKYTAHPEKGPIGIQDHGNPVKFRNIWVREFKPAHGEQVEPPYILDKGEKKPIE
ncbi:DUF1080 domain-containing protein [Rubripirellula amarantea]|uniref:3-keto-alpha-glucoside-1,2-lyase/3-keto-2-hydroxy-glucal hydratase domain-containing protein n=1 Tax=Rubripirellula amarantea TaxID=2527999 RepID=A0A5C5WNL3_9BACT|nr:DUF1080 domain-containing protein [Rubripirellula amarantea]MDA8743635.1 DUF1080 domain-containing protein [Rubripirellula amarantea]TWT52416.1 hypothetical protein Pla22_00400 [Rubripirellula amarantea]